MATPLRGLQPLPLIYSECDFFSCTPTDAKKAIISLLDPLSASRLACTCRSLRKLTEENIFTFRVQTVWLLKVLFEELAHLFSIKEEDVAFLAELQKAISDEELFKQKFPPTDFIRHKKMIAKVKALLKIKTNPFNLLLTKLNDVANHKASMAFIKFDEQRFNSGVRFALTKIPSMKSACYVSGEACLATLESLQGNKELENLIVYKEALRDPEFLLKLYEVAPKTHFKSLSICQTFFMAHEVTPFSFLEELLTIANRFEKLEILNLGEVGFEDGNISSLLLLFNILAARPGFKGIHLFQNQFTNEGLERLAHGLNDPSRKYCFILNYHNRETVKDGLKLINSLPDCLINKTDRLI